MLLPPPSATSPARAGGHAFTLVELLVVMAVIVVLIVITGPAMNALKSSGDVTKVVYDVAGILEQSRAYAVANNTYVYVGLAEVDVSKSTGATPQTAGNGRLGVAVVATKDGTQGFSASNVINASTWQTAYPSFSRNLTVVGKPSVFDNVHVPDLNSTSNPPPATGNMVRPALDNNATGPSNSVGNGQCLSATPFDYPVGSTLGAGQYSFTKVIQFDPQGVARIQGASNPSSIASYIEIGLQQTHGAAVPALATSPSTGNIAAIQIDGVTGAVRIYRP